MTNDIDQRRSLGKYIDFLGRELESCEDVSKAAGLSRELFKMEDMLQRLNEKEGRPC